MSDHVALRHAVEALLDRYRECVITGRVESPAMQDAVVSALHVLAAEPIKTVGPLGPLTRRHVLVFRGDEPDAIAAETSSIAEHFGDDCPLLIFIADSTTVQALDVDDMRAAGWIRMPELGPDTEPREAVWDAEAGEWRAVT